MKYLSLLYKSEKTIFRIDDLKIIRDIVDENHIRKILFRIKKTDDIKNLYYGIWALPKYNKKELANKIISPSYISLEYVLFEAGIIFQYYNENITAVAQKTKTYAIDENNYHFSRIRESMLYNPIQILYKKNYYQATPERAFCDYVYIAKSTFVDNPEGLNKEKIQELIPYYPPKTALKLKKFCNAQSTATQ